MLKKYPPKNSPRAKNTVFDIHPRENFGWNRIRETVSLRRHIYRRHPVLTSFGALALILVVVLTADTFLGHANTVHWYPGSCLGGWTNSANAAGAPELSPLATADEFTADNSAILNNSISQMFCGGFGGDLPPQTTPVSVVLNISWAFKTISGPSGITQSGPSGNTTNPPLDPVSSTPSALSDETPSTPDIISPSTDEALPEPVLVPAPEITPDPTPSIVEPATVPAPEPVPTPESAPAPTEGDSSPAVWIFHPVRQAFAQETSTTVPESAMVDTVANEATSSDPIDDEEVSDSKSVLKVSYSIDGENWQSLGMIGESNWQNAKFSIPIVVWADLSKLQISLASISVSDIAPIVYLDGMSLEVEYADQVVPDDTLDGPDLENDKLLLDQNLPDMRVVNVERRKSKIAEIWMSRFQSEDGSTPPPWVKIASDDSNVSFFLLGVEHDNIFWTDKDRIMISRYNIKSGSYNSVGVDPENTTTFIRYEDGKNDSWTIEFNLASSTAPSVAPDITSSTVPSVTPDIASSTASSTILDIASDTAEYPK